MEYRKTAFYALQAVKYAQITQQLAVLAKMDIT